MWSALEQLDLETAQASVASDKDMILQIVRDGVGLESLNQAGDQDARRNLCFREGSGPLATASNQ